MTTLYQVPPDRSATQDELTFSHEQAAIAFPEFIPAPAQNQLARMFRDPYLLQPQERTELVAQLREAVSLEPAVPELRVLLGMTLCVNFEAQEALEEFRESVRLAPDSYIAHLKFGELLLRLRICSQAAEETRMAAELASNPLQAELARRQAATIRAMQRDGVERGGYGKLLSVFSRACRLFVRPQPGRRSAALDTSC